MDLLNNLSFIQIQDLAYLVLIAAIWTVILAAVMPGTGAIEVLAGVFLFFSAIAVLMLPVNPWALPLILLGIIAFFLELWKPAKGIFLLISIALFTIGSVFLFRGSQGELAGVSWWLSAVGSLLTAWFFWFAFSKYLQSNRSVMDFSADKVVGQLGMAKTDIFHGGTIQAASALWSATSDTLIPAGSRVRVTARHGLKLTVVKED